MLAMHHPALEGAAHKHTPNHHPGKSNTKQQHATTHMAGQYITFFFGIGGRGVRE